jgi:hypothetical protein
VTPQEIADVRSKKAEKKRREREEKKRREEKEEGGHATEFSPCRPRELFVQAVHLRWELRKVRPWLNYAERFLCVLRVKQGFHEKPQCFFLLSSCFKRENTLNRFRQAIESAAVQLARLLLQRRKSIGGSIGGGGGGHCQRLGRRLLGASFLGRADASAWQSRRWR